MSGAGEGDRAGPRRFYADVTVDETPAGFAIALDGRGARTPARAPLICATRALAEAVAAEWRAQNGEIVFASMPLSRLQMTAIDAAPTQADAWRGVLVNYLQTDLLCYRAASPAALAHRQAAAWDPILDWMLKHIGVRLETTSGALAVPQPPASIERARQWIGVFSTPVLAASKEIAELTGSAALALAAAADAFAPDAIWRAAHVDEDFQTERWGADEEAAARRASMRTAFDAANTFLRAAAEADGRHGAETR